MTALLIAWLATAFGLGISMLLLSGIKANNYFSFAIAVTVLSLINISLRPLLWFLTAPLSILSFGLFALVINAFMIMLTGFLVPNFKVKGFLSALLAALIMAIIGMIFIATISLFTGVDISWTSYEYTSP